MSARQARFGAALALALALALAADGASVGLRVAILTTPGWSSIDFLVQTLQGYGVPFDVLRIDAATAPPTNVTALLTNADGSAKYAGLYIYPSLEAIGTLTRAQVTDLRAYQVASGARSVVFGAWATNFGMIADTASCRSTDDPMLFTNAAPLGISGVKRTAQLSPLGLWRCPGLAPPAPAMCSIWASDFAATGLQANCSAVSILDFAGTSPTASGGLITTYADGRETMAFLFDCAVWSPSCLLLAHTSLAWLLRDIIPGSRRALLSVQADDVFLTTEYSAREPISRRLSYRLTPGHLNQHRLWQNTIKTQLPAGSDLRLDMPFNGNGVLEQVLNNLGGVSSPFPPLFIDGRSCIDFPEYVTLGCNCWFTGTAACPATAPLFCRQCAKDFAKPPGTGTNRVPANALATVSNWNVSIMRNEDPLFERISLNTSNLANSFWWSHHTWSHQNLDNATFYDADMQLALNKELAATGRMNMAGRPTFSSRCMVTPQISGLLNGDALAALVKNGITCATGDNTWPFLGADPANPHRLRYTTSTANGYEGFAILPRFATEIYYNCSTVAQNEALYNRLYAAYYGSPSTINQIVAREATRVMRDGILKLRADPYMMHQANLAIIDRTNVSLVMRWTGAVVAEYNKVVAWPLESLKLDDLYDLYKAREARDACNLAYTLQVTNGTVTGVTVAAGSGGACSAPLLVPGAGGAAGARTVAVPAGGAGTTAITGIRWPVL